MTELTGTYTEYCQEAGVKPSKDVIALIKGQYPEEIMELDFSRVYIARKMVTVIGKLVEACRNLERLNLKGCQMENNELQLLDSTLRKHGGIKEIILDETGLSLAGGKMLLELCKMNPTVKSISLRKTFISTEYQNRINLQLSLNNCKEIDMKDLSFAMTTAQRPDDEEWDLSSDLGDAIQHSEQPNAVTDYDDDFPIEAPTRASSSVSDLNSKNLPVQNMHTVSSKLFNTTEQWTDPAFPPSPSSLITSGGVKARETACSGIGWVRGHACSPTPRIFTNQNNPSPPKQSRSFWATNWLRNSMLALQRHPYLLTKLFLKANPDIGAYEIQICKSGTWHRVMIDDWLPCDKHGNLMGMVAEDPNELWVSLLEKAFAKLHGGYDLLENGSSVLGLSDLTGGITHNIFIRDHTRAKEVVVDSSYWETLRGYNRNGWLLTAACKTHQSVEVLALEESGIAANRHYEILNLTEVTGWKLVLLYTPYEEDVQSEGSVWIGDDWVRKQPEVQYKELFVKLSEPADVRREAKRWITFENFAIFFNKVYICRCETASTLRYQYRTERILSRWQLSTAGGKLTSQYFSENPCWCLRVKEKNTPILMQLSVSDPKLSKKEIPGRIGLYVFRSPNPDRKKRYWDQSDCVVMANFAKYRDICTEVLCQPCINYFVVPCMEKPGVYSPFQLTFTSAHTYCTHEVLSKETEFICKSAWKGLAAGGRTTGSASWRNNPQFSLRVSEPGSFGFILHQKPEKPENIFFISFTVYKTNGERITEHSPENKIVSPDFVPYPTVFTECDLLEGAYTIIPMTWSPGEETAFELSVFTSCKAALAPLPSLLTQG